METTWLTQLFQSIYSFSTWNKDLISEDKSALWQSLGSENEDEGQSSENHCLERQRI